MAQDHFPTSGPPKTHRRQKNLKRISVSPTTGNLPFNGTLPLALHCALLAVDEQNSIALVSAAWYTLRCDTDVDGVLLPRHSAAGGSDLKSGDLLVQKIENCNLQSENPSCPQ